MTNDKTQSETLEDKFPCAVIQTNGFNKDYDRGEVDTKFKEAGYEGLRPAMEYGEQTGELPEEYKQFDKRGDCENCLYGIAKRGDIADGYFTPCPRDIKKNE